MTVDELRTHIWASRVAQKEAEIVSLLTDLNIAQQRIKALEEAQIPKPENFVSIKKDGSNETPLRAD